MNLSHEILAHFVFISDCRIALLVVWFCLPSIIYLRALLFYLLCRVLRTYIMQGACVCNDGWQRHCDLPSSHSNCLLSRLASATLMCNTISENNTLLYIERKKLTEPTILHLIWSFCALCEGGYCVRKWTAIAKHWVELRVVLSQVCSRNQTSSLFMLIWGKDLHTRTSSHAHLHKEKQHSITLILGAITRHSVASKRQTSKIHVIHHCYYYHYSSSECFMLAFPADFECVQPFFSKEGLYLIL